MKIEVVLKVGRDGLAHVARMCTCARARNMVCLVWTALVTTRQMAIDVCVCVCVCVFSLSLSLSLSLSVCVCVCVRDLCYQAILLGMCNQSKTERESAR